MPVDYLLHTGSAVSWTRSSLSYLAVYLCAGSSWEVIGLMLSPQNQFIGSLSSNTTLGNTVERAHRIQSVNSSGNLSQKRLLLYRKPTQLVQKLIQNKDAANFKGQEGQYLHCYSSDLVLKRCYRN